MDLPYILDLNQSSYLKKFLSNISIPIVKIATENTGSPTIGLKKVLSIIKLKIPVKETPNNNAIQNGKPLSTASELIIPAPTTAKCWLCKT